MMTTAKIDYQQNAIHVAGELNFTTAVSLWKESLSRLPAYTALHFDLADVSASNSGGVALLLEWMKYAKQQNKPIHFNHIPASLLSILSVSGVASMLDGSVLS